MYADEPGYSHAVVEVSHLPNRLVDELQWRSGRDGGNGQQMINAFQLARTDRRQAPTSLLPLNDELIDDSLPLLALHAVKAADGRGALASSRHLTVDKGREEVLPILSAFSIALIGVRAKGAGNPEDVGAAGVGGVVVN